MSASRFCGEHDFLSTNVATTNRQFEEPTIHMGSLGKVAFLSSPSVELNSDVCQTGQASPLLSYGIGAGSLGTAVHGNDTFALNATGGFLVFQASCDASGESCLVSQLTDMRVTLTNTVVSGTTLSNVEGRLRRPAAVTVIGGVRKIAKQDFDLQLSGAIGGSPALMRVFPSADVTVNLNNQTTSLSFAATFDASIPELGGVPVNIAATIPGSTANPGAACAGFSRLQVVMGFEDLGWTSTQAQLSLSATQRTQGCFALKVAGSGYMTLNSAPFATPVPGVTSTLKLDVFVPPGQPNPFWFGAVQLYASCPSGGMYNAYLGQAELTGLPTGTFSTVSYAVPSNVRSTLSGTHNDCFFSVAVNVNQTPTPVVLDNLRFSQ
jgi:hypothetical protein